MKIIVFTVLFMVSFISYANDNKLIKKVDTLSCQEIEINDSVFLKAISIFKDSLQNRFFCDYCTSVFINFENDEQIQFGVKSIYKTNLFIGLSNWTKDSTPSEMALCSFVWNDIRFLTRKDILVKLGVDYKVLNSNRKLNINDFLKKWSDAEQKGIIINELQQQGVLLEPLAEEVGKDFDAFDLICHVAFDQPPLTRRERVEKVKKRNYFVKYGAQARKVLEKLLEKYADTGIQHIEDIKVLTVSPFSDLGTAVQLVSAFGGKSDYLKAVQELKYELYA